MAKKKKLSKRQWKKVGLTLALLIFFIGIRQFVGLKIAEDWIWILGVFDTFISFSGVALLYFIVDAIFGKGATLRR